MGALSPSQRFCTTGPNEVQGLKYPQARIDAMKEMAALKQEVSLLCCKRISETARGALALCAQIRTGRLVPVLTNELTNLQTLLDDCVEAYVSAAINKSMTAMPIVVGRSFASSSC